MSPRSEVADHVTSGLQCIIAQGGGAVGNTGWGVLIVERSAGARHGCRLPRAMMIANCKRSKRSSACRLESFSLTGWTRARGSG
jgi:hypothetical protein